MPKSPSKTAVAGQALTDRGRRRVITGGGTLLLSLLVSPTGFAAASPAILAVRTWPAEEYTRITMESDAALVHSEFQLDNPLRLVVDLTGLRINEVLQSLHQKVLEKDPYIARIRVGQFKTDVVRLVIDLKAPIKSQVFALKPAGDYKHRLVVDLYPMAQPDPLLAFLEQNEADKKAAQGTSTPSPAPETTPEKTNSIPATSIVTIAIDPGHGGEDPGAIGSRGTYEKDVTLAISKKLKAKIDANPRMRSMLTRNDDFYVPLNKRVSKARAVKADFFVSIHADAFIRPDASGSSVFVLSDKGASSAAARWLANNENNADLIGGTKVTNDDHLAKTLLDLSLTATRADSAKMGKLLLGSIGKINKLHKADIESAGFAVLKAPDVPSVLIETAFISNPQEEQLLIDPDHQDKLASAIYQAIAKHFNVA